MNLSNMPGLDREPVVAVHPVAGWAVVLWVNNPPGETNTAVFVRVQDPSSKDWKRGLGVNTAPAAGFASNPDMAIDRHGRIHVVFGQEPAGGGSLYTPHYTYSDDAGETWSNPEALPGGNDVVELTIGVDPRDQLHIVYATSSCADCFRHTHLVRAAAAPAGAAWQTTYLPEEGHASHLRSTMSFVQLPNGTMRTVVGALCMGGCGPRRARAFVRDEPAGAWYAVEIPGAAGLHPDQKPNALSSLSFTAWGGLPWICFAWGDYWRSIVASSCSSDGGFSWQPPETIISTQEPDMGAAPTITAVPNATPDPNGGPSQAGQFESIDRGYAPVLLYDESTNKLLAVWLLWQAQEPRTVYLAYSYKKIDDAGWTPFLDGPQHSHEPALRLLPATRRSHAVGQPALASSGSGLAYVAWLEQEGDENVDVYLGSFNAGAMLAEVQR